MVSQEIANLSNLNCVVQVRFLLPPPNERIFYEKR